ncbi:hypothetical protein DMA12_11880 [Amycolatopsis balhimycina DSM 5908]|uniref:Uncharacterized protein n=1 Tax=Amycolatopsis balhimycina DSM 5908 TaxID=1081091 RepID=A0A428WSD3_AMYBA|nr:hypothetical protein DMA12_11880 [Amycolatopsis balhimycina DSM 5908]
MPGPRQGTGPSNLPRRRTPAIAERIRAFRITAPTGERIPLTVTVGAAFYPVIPAPILDA